MDYLPKSKTCTQCHETKPVVEFRVRNKSKDQHSPWCKVCFSKYEKNKWATDPQRRQTKMELGKKRIKRLRAFVWDFLLQHPCTKCGEPDPMVLEFDHLDPSTKTMNITDMVGLGLSIENISKEITKCRVLCANCHRRHTYKQQGFWLPSVGSNHGPTD
jgi:hypothetical protein